MRDVAGYMVTFVAAVIVLTVALSILKFAAEQLAFSITWLTDPNGVGIAVFFIVAGFLGAAFKSWWSGR